MPKITKLKKKNELWPGDVKTGDILVDNNYEVFVYVKNMWRLIGGRFMKREDVDLILQYLSSGWDSAEIIKQDLETLFFNPLFKEPPPEKKDRFAAGSSYWYSLFIINLTKVASEVR